MRVTERKLGSSTHALLASAVRFFRDGNSKRGWAELSDGRRLPTRYRKARDGSETVLIDTASMRKSAAESEEYIRKLGYERLYQLHTTYTVKDWRDRDGTPEAIEPLVVASDPSGHDEICNVRGILRSNDDLWHPAVRVAVERWRHIIMYAEHFRAPGAYKTAHPAWVEVAEQQLGTLNHFGRGILKTAKERSIKPQDAWVFREALGGRIDWWFLEDLFLLLPELREQFRKLRQSGNSEDESVASVIGAVKTLFEIRAARGDVAYDKRRGRVSPHEPAASLPLTSTQRLRLELIADEHLWGAALRPPPMPDKEQAGNSLGTRVSFQASRDDMTPSLIEGTLSKLPYQTMMEIKLSGLTPWWRSAPLLPPLGPTKLDLIVEFLRATNKTSTAPNTNEEVSIRGGRAYLTSRRCPTRTQFFKAFNEWRLEKPRETLKTQHRRAKGPGLLPQIEPRYLFPEFNTYKLPTDSVRIVLPSRSLS